MEKSKPRKNVKALIKKGAGEEFGSIDARPKKFEDPGNKYTKKLEEKKVNKRLRDKEKVKKKPHLNKKVIAKQQQAKMGGSEIDVDEILEDSVEVAEEIEFKEDKLVKEVEEELKYKMD